MNDEVKVARHISHAFDEELSEVRSKVLKMGGLVEQQLDRVLLALSEGDVGGLSNLAEKDDQINQMEIDIDDECTQIIARRQPTAGDLRLVIATTKCVRDLERIGDEIERVGNMIRHAVENEIKSNYYKGILSLGENVKGLLHSTLNAYARMETRRAVKNIRKDFSIDDEYGSIVRRLVKIMQSEDGDIQAALDVMWAARSLERIGDHCINICENVIYLVEGTDVRHTDYEEIREQLS